MTKQHKAGLLLIAILLLVKYGVQPWWNWQSEKQATIQHLQHNKNRLENLQSRAELVQLQEQSINENFRQLEQYWLTDSVAQPQVLILRHVERLAAYYQLELSTRNIGQPTQSPVTGLPVSLFVSGHPQNVRQFILALEAEQPVGLIYGIRFVKPRPFDEHITSLFDVLFLLKPEEVAS